MLATYLILVLLNLVGALTLDQSLGRAAAREYLVLVLEYHVYLLSELACARQHQTFTHHHFQ